MTLRTLALVLALGVASTALAQAQLRLAPTAGIAGSEVVATVSDTVLLNNGYLGYGCGFNSQGDVTIHLRAPGQEAMHDLSFYPSIYQGEVTGPGAPATPDANATYLQVPMLHAEDHPGEVLPAMHLAFEVRR